ncbi:EamA family transporter [bacterium]|uniref:DMT family transporter n=1 Tax=candidate division WOR-3 bacterium TaxID=2052148 RepID=A0A7C0ZKX5_UNCW3|nr:MAG: EamA family transporter [bacterium]HDI83004.1 DMT family transporter [candidate division WOR-3 bacterium]
MSERRGIRSDIILLTASIIWGFAFAFQKKGMDFIGPFLFTGLRFILGSLVVLPFLFRKGEQGGFKESIILGFLLFAGVSLQQVGIVYTTAGKAGFITGLYVVFVPVVGYLMGIRTRRLTWIGAGLAIVGLYLLSIRGRFYPEKGDLLVLLGAVFWTFHVIYISKFTKGKDPLKLAFGQFLVCGILGMGVAFVLEDISMSGVFNAGIPLLYAGVLSSGIAYTLQVVGQKRAHPSHAAVILSLESLFAAIGGFLLLHEVMTPKEILGAALMLTGMMISHFS